MIAQRAAQTAAQTRVGAAGGELAGGVSMAGQGEFSRADMLGRLAEEMRRAAAAGDVEAARVAHEAMGRLLALMAASGPVGGGAAVLDLATERDRRRGR